jgi:hypothetical protein
LQYFTEDDGGHKVRKPIEPHSPSGLERDDIARQNSRYAQSQDCREDYGNPTKNVHTDFLIGE